MKKIVWMIIALVVLAVIAQGASIIQIRRDTAANWAAANPTLAQGEMGYETDANKLKVGNGITDWNSLGYLIQPDTWNTSQEMINAVSPYILDNNNSVNYYWTNNNATLYSACQSYADVNDDVGITVETDPLWSGNESSVARIGNCPQGQLVMNTTTSGVECTTIVTSESDPYYFSNPQGYYNISTLPATDLSDYITTTNFTIQNNTIKAYTDGKVSDSNTTLKAYADNTKANLTTTNTFTQTQTFNRNITMAVGTCIGTANSPICWVS